MAYKCHNCEAPILVLRLGYCVNCREPISSDILPESKKQALAESEREYEAMRERIRAQKDAGKAGEGGGSLDIGIVGGEPSDLN
jgi:predicted amidophosphoribosyltransferase